MDKRKLLGNRGEAAVADYLKKNRCRILASQYRCRFGELDLVALCRDGTVAFVEVKTRTTDKFSPARLAVTPAKQRRMRTAAQVFLEQAALGDHPCRFDVAEVYPGPGGDWLRPQINYITNAFQ